MKVLKFYVLLMGFALTMFSCGPSSEERRDTMEDNGERLESDKDITDNSDNNREHVEQMATANITSASGSNLTGTATFTAMEGDKVRFEISVENATPGQHAVHLHESGDCSASDAKSAGGHWNPTNEQHGKRGTEHFHKGDIGNLEVGSDGKGSMSMVVDGWCIGGSDDCNVLNKAVIVHAGADDFTSQPSGAAGDRVGCGVVQKK